MSPPSPDSPDSRNRSAPAEACAGGAGSGGPPRLLEVCADSIEGALAAQEGGAARIELCAALSEGGLTPSLGLVEAAVEALRIPVHVMVRPRAGDFLYSPRELAVMRRDIRLIRGAGARGVVLGALREDGTVDIDGLRGLAAEAEGLGVTFHRAIDLARDGLEALDALVACGVERVLTSGGAPTALEGAAALRRLVEAAAGRIAVMAGGGIRAGSLPALLEATGVREVHASAGAPRPSGMRHRNDACRLGSGEAGGAYGFRTANVEEVRALVRALCG